MFDGQAMDILDQEVDEDEAFRNDYSVNRLSSQEANQELAKKGERYRNILTQAADSDATVRRTWEEWETNILELTWDAVSDLLSSTLTISGLIAYYVG